MRTALVFITVSFVSTAPFLNVMSFICNVVIVILYYFYWNDHA